MREFASGEKHISLLAFFFLCEYKIRAKGSIFRMKKKNLRPGFIRQAERTEGINSLPFG